MSAENQNFLSNYSFGRPFDFAACVGLTTRPMPATPLTHWVEERMGSRSDLYSLANRQITWPFRESNHSSSDIPLKHYANYAAEC
jgi:hypothetical protein